MFAIDMKKIGSIFGLGRRTIAVIDFDENSLKTAYAKVSKGALDDLNFSTKNINSANDNDISEAIRTEFSEQKLNPAVVLSIVPSHLVITKNIEIPSRDPHEIEEIISLQAGRHTPYSREEIIIDYVDIGAYKHNYTKVLLVIVPRNVIKRQFEIFRNAGIHLDKVLFAAESIGQFISKVSKSDTQDFPVSVVHISEDFTDFTVIFKEKVMYLRNIPIGALHLTKEKEYYALRFTEEIKNSLEAYESESIEKMPNRIILTGLIDEAMRLESSLNESLRIPVSNLFYLNFLPLGTRASSLEPLVRTRSFLHIIAPLLTFDNIKLGLIPEEIKLKRAFQEKSKDIIKAGIFIITIFVLICSLLISKVYFKNSYLKRLKTIYSPQSKEVVALERDFTRIQVIKNVLSARGYSLEVLGELYTILPQNILLSDIKFDSQGKFSIKGIAKSMAAVFSFVEDMEKSDYFTDVKNRYTTKRKLETGDVADFEIVCLLSKKFN